MLAFILVPIGIPFQATGLLLTRVISGFRYAFYYFTIVQIINLPNFYNFWFTSIISVTVKYAPQLVTTDNYYIFQLLTIIALIWNFCWQFFVFNIGTMFMYNHLPGKKFKAIRQAIQSISRRYQFAQR